METEHYMRHYEHCTPARILGIAFATLLICAFFGLQAAWAGTSTDSPNASAAALSAGSMSQITDEGSQQTQSTSKKSSITYCAKLVGDEWQTWKNSAKTAGSTKKSSKLESLAIKLVNGKGSSIQYQVHIVGFGWQKVLKNGKVAGFADKNRTIDAVRIALTGELSKTHEISYRVNAADSGWMSWKKDGATAKGPRSKTAIRAIQVKLVKKAKPTSAGAGIVNARYRAVFGSGAWTTRAANNEKVGVVNQHQPLKDLRISLDTGAYSGSIEYRALRANGKWTPWKRNGQAVNAGQSIEAIKVRLKGKLAKKYDVVYRVYVQDIGWMRRMRNGEVAGLQGQGLQIEAVKIQIVPKSKASGWVSDGENWSYYQKGKKLTNSWVVTTEHPIDLTMSGLQRYWIGADGVLAVSRYINPLDELDSNADWTAYALPVGYVARGKFTNDDGLLLADTAGGRLYTKTRWVTTDEFDGTEQRYRLVKQGVACVVQTGLFEVNGKKYYGLEDGSGYVLCSANKYINGVWYRANAKGVLKPTSNKSIVEKYVQWAIDTANDNSHGYSQATRWGPDYDCSSFVCASLLAAGFPDSGASWTGNMRTCLRKVGFVWHKGTSGLQRGDIMLVHNSARQHTEIYIGNNQLVGAHISETGGIYGQAGDQTGNEISVTGYYNSPWQGYLRFEGLTTMK